MGTERIYVGVAAIGKLSMIIAQTLISLQTKYVALTGPIVGIEPRTRMFPRRVSVPFGVAPFMSCSNLALRSPADIVGERERG